MQTFDQSLMFLFKNKLITYEEALRQATNKDDFALRVQGISSSDDSKWSDFEREIQPPSPSQDINPVKPVTPKKDRF